MIKSAKGESLVRHIVRRAIGTFLCISVLSFCASFLLHDAALIREILPAGRSSLEIDSVVVKGPSLEGDDGFAVEVSGRAPSGAWIEAGIGRRRLKEDWVSLDGRFRFYLSVPPEASRIWVRELDEMKEEKARTSAEIGEQRPFRAAFALGVPDAGWVWLAGNSSPGRAISLFFPGDTLPRWQAMADDDGLLDVFVPAPGGIPDFLRIRDDGDESYGEGGVDEGGAPARNSRMDTLTVARTPLDSLRLSRKVILSLSDSSVQNRFAAILPRAAKNDNVSQVEREARDSILRNYGSVLRFEIELPRNHPLASALLLGLLPMDRILEKAFGRLHGEVLYMEQEMHRFLSRLQDGVARDIETVASPEIRLLKEDSASVTFQGELVLLVGGEFGLGWGGEPTLSRLPLLTTRDSLIVALNVRRLDWLASPFAGNANGDQVRWGGPRVPDSGYLSRREDISLGFSEQNRFSRIYSGPARINAKKIHADTGSRREYIARFEEHSAGTFLARIWRVLLSFIPFAWAFWLIRRQGKEEGENWGSLLGMGVVFAFWTCRDVLGFVQEGLYRVPYLANLVGMPFYMVRDSRSGLDFDADLWNHVSNGVFWAPFLVLIGLVPLYFKGLSGDAATVLEAEWRRKSLAWLSIRVALLLACLVLAVLCLINPEMIAKFLQTMGMESASPSSGMESGLEGWFRNFGPWIGIALIALGFCAWGLPGFAFGIGQAALLLHVYSPYRMYSPQELPEAMVRAWEALKQLPAWTFPLLVAVSSFFLVRKLLADILPFPSRRRTTLAAAAMTAAFLAFPFLSVRASLETASVCLFVGLAWAVYFGIPATYLLPARFAARRLPLVLLIAGAALVALLIGWPAGKDEASLGIWLVGSLVERMEGLLPYLLGFGFLLRMRRQCPPGSVALRESHLDIGMFLFSALLVGLSITSLWLPIPFLIALALGRYWLFRPSAEITGSGEADLRDAGDMRDFIRKAMEGVFARSRLRTALDHLDEKLGKLEITPQDYAQKKESLQSHFEARSGQPLAALDDVSRPNQGPPWVFSIGGPDIRSNVAACLQVGALLSAVPILIGIYQNLPAQSAGFPYPLADFFIFLAAALLNWLLLIVFFGLYYPYLRGGTGLVKGAWFSLLLVVPYLATRFLVAQDFDQMRLFLLWGAQLLLFLSLLGLLAGDWRLLRDSGLRARNLLLVHNLPVLSAYVSAVTAALVTSVAGLLTGKLTDLFGFFLGKVGGN